MRAASVMDWQKQILQKISHIRIGIACQYQSGNFSDVFAYFRVQRDAEPVYRHSDKHPFYVRFSRRQGPSASSPPAFLWFFSFSTSAGRAQGPPSQPPFLPSHRRIKKNAVAHRFSRRPACNPLIAIAWISAPLKTFAPGLLKRGPGPSTPGICARHESAVDTRVRFVLAFVATRREK